ncbi:MFS transporter [Chelatococcus reniformis]|uniref:MFS transporter n=1 Tax=Chelatococcus reniformis TaxID=1494448 RepID=A0A916U5F4_9HYPH|nr:MFS transporter [Chelatococcus reniformis]GGC61329.1 MFS transporter [Chelatococcus reniformis]
MIACSPALRLGLAQMIAWGTSYYLIGGFGSAIAAELGWSQNLVYGGFGLALLVMGLTSGTTGRLIDVYGGRRVMGAGAVLNALGCAALASCHGVALYVAAWTCLGVAMRLTLYDAAFAALARAGGPQARRPMAQITLLGGLASTTFWPLGAVLTTHLGWRGALWVFAGLALLCIPLNAALSDRRYGEDAPAGSDRRPLPEPLASAGREATVAAVLFASLAATTNVLNAAMSSHMIAILAGLGLTASASVWVGALRGVGQSAARALEVVFQARTDPLTLNLSAMAMIVASFASGLLGGQTSLASIGFAFLYGAGNGLITITRGALPLVLFDHRSYGAVVGRLLAPSFILSAAAPLAFAFIPERFGPAGALYLSLALAISGLAAALALKLRFGARGRARAAARSP